MLAQGVLRQTRMLGVTVSIDIYTMQPQIGATHTDLIKLADKALYQAKEKGRDRLKLPSVTLAQCLLSPLSAG